MGIFLKKKDQIPDIVISSSAERAKTTAELAIKAGNWNSNFYIDERIYGRSSDFLLELTKLIDDKHKVYVLLVMNQPAQVLYPKALFIVLGLKLHLWLKLISL